MIQSLRVAFAIAVVAAPVGALVSDAGAPLPDATEAPEAPLRLSPSDAADLDALRRHILGLIDGTGWRSSEWGVMAVSLDRGDTLVTYGDDLLLAPASNQKIITSAAALHYLGADYRFSTFLLADGEIRDGVLEGDLILYGTGDPAISDRIQRDANEVWRTFASALRDRGIHTVTGRLLGDESFFEGPSRRPSWNPADLDNWYAAPVSALTYAENVVRIQVTGGVTGSRAVVRTEPSGATIPVVNASLTVPGTSTRGLRLGREDPDGPLLLEGEIGSESRGVWRETTVSDPATYAVSVFDTVLEGEGIRVLGGIGKVSDGRTSSVSGRGTVAPSFTGGTPIHTIAVHRSPPLSELLEVLNKRSHNLYAEVLLFALGRAVEGEASFAAGSRAVGRYLRDVVGVPGTEFVVEDGSGLSRLNRATPALFVEVMRHVSAQEYANVFWGSLPEAGNRRELGRMYYTPAAGNLRAKTGTIARVSALSGQVLTADGERVLFSIVSNNVPSTSRSKNIEDLIGVELASFRRATAAFPTTSPVLTQSD